MRNVLSPRPSAHLRSKELYDASSISVRLQVIMMSKKGSRRIELPENKFEQTEFDCCQSCHSSLFRSAHDATRREITEEQLDRRTKSEPLLPPKHAIANNFAFIAVQLTEPLRYDERRLISLGDPRGNFCAISANTGNTITRGVLALTGNRLIWDQHPAPSIALVLNEILRSFLALALVICGTSVY